MAPFETDLGAATVRKATLANISRQIGTLLQASGKENCDGVGNNVANWRNIKS